ncbi:metal-dependent hydrolase [Kushneria indalinina]|uniref:LexA-binding, inner membrane-associated putative hydrolase n=1 Tax=Kushneria indalinina DSM 14324 TaxID=1122140 RepID=A0A3D9DYF5_9GAMM|nr:metal-dependent hydrolase [Kushneria indalinina]REC95379.1 LexA-binding, inner membrane-associated putative hydrolase [Kushneria indalinina DSM 14324]
MANFTTHFSVAAAGGALVGGLGWQAGLWPFVDVFPVAGLVALGGVVPDIDADQSRAVRLIFTLMAMLAVIGCVSALQPFLSLAELSGVGVGAYLFVRYPMSTLFKRFSVHRGIWHSLLAAVLAALVVAAVSYHLFVQTAIQSWIFAGAMLIGVLIHLLLDEIYSIDIEGRRLKRSFGTAFKLYDYGTPQTALLMGVVMLSMTPWLPPYMALQDIGNRVWALWS